MDEIKITEIDRAESAFKIMFAFLFIVALLSLAVVIYSAWRYIFSRKSNGQTSSRSSPQPSDTGYVASSPRGLGMPDSVPMAQSGSQETLLTDSPVRDPFGTSGQASLGTNPTDSTCQSSRRSPETSRTQSGYLPTAPTSSQETLLTDTKVKEPYGTSRQAILDTNLTGTACIASLSHETSKTKVDFHRSGQIMLDTPSQSDLTLHDSLTDDTRVKVPVSDSSVDIPMSLESSQSLGNNVNRINTTHTSLKLSSSETVLNRQHKEAMNEKYHTINKKSMALTQDNFHCSHTPESKHQRPESDNTPDPTGATVRKVAQEHDDQTKIEDEHMLSPQGDDRWYGHETRETDPVHPSSFVGTSHSDPNEQQGEQLALLADD